MHKYNIFYIFIYAYMRAKRFECEIRRRFCHQVLCPLTQIFFFRDLYLLSIYSRVE